MPSTAEVLQLIGAKGVIVGSFPRLGEQAKDIDVVIKETEGRNPLLQEIVKRWPDSFESGIIGHVLVRSHPMKVEIFAGILPLKDKAKEANQLSYNQARRRAIKREYFGVECYVVL